MPPQLGQSINPLCSLNRSSVDLCHPNMAGKGWVRALQRGGHHKVLPSRGRASVYSMATGQYSDPHIPPIAQLTQQAYTRSILIQGAQLSPTKGTRPHGSGVFAGSLLVQAPLQAHATLPSSLSTLSPVRTTHSQVWEYLVVPFQTSNGGATWVDGRDHVKDGLHAIHAKVPVPHTHHLLPLDAFQLPVKVHSRPYMRLQYHSKHHNAPPLSA